MTTTMPRMHGKVRRTVEHRLLAPLLLLGMLGTSGAAAVGASLLAEPEAQASDIGRTRRFGVGLMTGSAPGLSAKYWLAKGGYALDFGLGLGLGDFGCSDEFNLCSKQYSANIDYLAGTTPGVFDFYYGLGVRLWVFRYEDNFGTDEGNDVRVAGRIPFGLSFMPLDGFEGFLEAVPSVAFGPTNFYLEGVIGFRIYL